MKTSFYAILLQKNVFIVALIYISFSIAGFAQQSLEDKYPIIPTPQQLSYGSDELSFSKYQISNSNFSNEVELIEHLLINQGITPSNDGIRIEIVKNKIKKITNDEAYSLKIDTAITIQANHKKGAFYAIQTLKQIIRFKGNKAILPKIEITDWPAFKIRGFMHDTGRNYQSLAQLKEQLEVMAQYKYNVFHWHLTDNPGWRLESKIYPELQSENPTSRQKGNFYTQEDFKEIFAFCKERKITVIPELDIPGHTEAFRKALKIKTMRDPKVKPILLDLFAELMTLADANEMPYIHIGTDEVKSKTESVSNDVLLDIMNLIKDSGREVIVWKQGIQVKGDSTSINQLWAQHEGRKGHRFIDSRANYINHLDPFAGATRLFFQQPCRQPKGDDLALGGILCAWPDNNIGHERDILTQNPIYPSMVFYADAIWKGRAKDYKEYWAKLPSKESEEFKAFQQFEKKVIMHRNLFFNQKEFQYVTQTDKYWKLVGPFNHKGDFEKIFIVEKELKENYNINGKDFKWTNTHTGGTIHIKHFFGFPAITKAKSGTYYAYTNIYSPDDRLQDFWIGFQGWSRSSRRGGPTPNQGQWHFTKSKIWVNDMEIAPPIWKQPNLGEETHETPFVDEDYFFRPPTKIQLKKGWNKVLLKIPHGGKSWKWMFTCVPININQLNVREVNDLIFDPTLRVYSNHYYKRKNLFDNEADTTDEIIFLGNSITEGGKWEDLFPNFNAINRGISGDVTRGIIDRLEEVTSSAPNKIFLLIGINDLARGKTVEYVLSEIDSIAQKIKIQSPKTKLYIQSILPVNPKVGDQFLGHKNKSKEVRAINNGLLNIVKTYNTHFIDLHKQFRNIDGNLKAKFTHDGLHLNMKGYKKWRRILNKYVIN